MVGTVVDEILHAGGCVLVVHHGEMLPTATLEFRLDSGLVPQDASNGIEGAAP